MYSQELVVNEMIPTGQVIISVITKAPSVEPMFFFLSFWLVDLWLLKEQNSRVDQNLWVATVVKRSGLIILKLKILLVFITYAVWVTGQRTSLSPVHCFPVFVGCAVSCLDSVVSITNEVIGIKWRREFTSLSTDLKQ